MFKITAPEKSYNGVSSNIAFVNGVAIAELDPFTREWFLSKGYSLEEIKNIVSKYFKIEKVIGLKAGKIHFEDDPIGANTVIFAQKVE